MVGAGHGRRGGRAARRASRSPAAPAADVATTTTLGAATTPVVGVTPRRSPSPVWSAARRPRSVPTSARRRASPVPTGTAAWRAAPSSTPPPPLPTPRSELRRFGVRGRARLSATRSTPPGSPRPGLPFVGAASTTGGRQHRRLRVRGRAAALQTRVVSPAWGAQLRSLLGTAQGSHGHGRGRRRRARHRARGAGPALAAGGGRSGRDPSPLPVPPTPLPDLAPATTTLTAGSPAVVLLLTSPATTTGLAQRLTRGRVHRHRRHHRRRSTNPTPAVANGLTVLVPYAPFEQDRGQPPAAPPTSRRSPRARRSRRASPPATGRPAARLMLAQVGRRLDPRAVPRRRQAATSRARCRTPSAARPGPRCAPRACRAERSCRATARATSWSSRTRAATRSCHTADDHEDVGASVAVVEAEADLHGHLVPGDRAVVHRAADVGHLEPVEVAQRLRPRARCRCGWRRRRPPPTSRRSPRSCRCDPLDAPGSSEGPMGRRTIASAPWH